MIAQGMLKRTVEPATLAVSVADLRQQARIDLSNEDDLLTAYLQSATQYYEIATRRALITQTWALSLDSWPAQIEFPIVPVQSVTITYLDANGDSQTLSGSNYTLLANGEPAVIIPAVGVTWPGHLAREGAITVTAVCGYGAAATAVPPMPKLAIMQLAAHHYKNREAVVEGSMSAVPFGVQSLIDLGLWR